MRSTCFRLITVLCVVALLCVALASTPTPVAALPTLFSPVLFFCYLVAAYACRRESRPPLALIRPYLPVLSPRPPPVS